MKKINDPVIDAIIESVLNGKGLIPYAKRLTYSRIIQSDNIAEEKYEIKSQAMASLIEKIVVNPASITDDDIDVLRSNFTEDEIYEVAVFTAFNCGLLRLNKSNELLKESHETESTTSGT